MKTTILSKKTKTVALNLKPILIRIALLAFLISFLVGYSLTAHSTAQTSTPQSVEVFKIRPTVEKELSESNQQFQKEYQLFLKDLKTKVAVLVEEADKARQMTARK